MAEHVVNCHRSISLHLQALFNAIMKHSYAPSDFDIGITIPLLKDNSVDGSNMDNYRAITIRPVLSKVFENCLPGPDLRRGQTGQLSRGLHN